MAVSFDSLLSDVGDFGRYQLIMYILLCLPASLPSSWTCFNQVFVAAVPDHWCRVPGYTREESLPTTTARDGQTRFAQCLQYNMTELVGNRTVIPCQNGWTYDTDTYKSTIATQFNLVCDLAFWPSLCTMMFYIGSFIGNILFGYIADKYGRRVSFFCILTAQVLFGTLNAFAPNIYCFAMLRFMVGLTFPALYQIPFIVSMEIMGPSKRIFAGMLICVFFGIAMCCLGIVAWLLRDWQLITLASNTPFALLFVYWFFFPESPRWLVTVQKYERAKKVLLQISKCNRKPVSPEYIDLKFRQIAEHDRLDEQEVSRHNLIDLFRTPNIRKKTIIITYIWFVNAVVYNGLTLNVSNLPVNDYLSFVINGAVELPASFIAWPLLDRVGRRWPLCLFMLFGGAACVSTIGLAFAGKFGIAGSFAVIYIFAGELYPTVIRALGMGMSSMVAGSGLILGPYLISLGKIVEIVPVLIMGAMMLSAGLASMFLPETLGTPLPQTIADAELFGTDVSVWQCGKKPKTHRGEKKDGHESELTQLAQ